jgi:Fe-S-cluster containining protein
VTSDLATLCQSCGLCCDGSLFGLVPLDRDEVALARKNRLHVLESDKGFEQPCAALSESGACSIYDERPRACDKFICRLYERQRREGGSLEPRLAAVQRVRALITEVRAQGLGASELEELQKRLEEDFARA